MSVQSKVQKRGRGFVFRRVAKWALIILFIAYLTVVAVFYRLQTKIIFPGLSTQGQAEAIVKAPEGCELVTLAATNGNKVAGLYGPALNQDGSPNSDAHECPTILYFLGNGTCIAYTLGFEFSEFRRLGANIFIVDYLGYGMSSGVPSEKNCYETANFAYQYLVSSKGVDPKKIVVYGRSLGAAVACDLASREPSAGLIMISAFTSMTETGKQLYSYLPVRWLLKHHFDTIDKIGKVNTPILLIHGKNDKLVPYWMSVKLKEAAIHSSKVTISTLATSGHEDVYVSGREQIIEDVREFLTDLKEKPVR
jgi:fermentation-respiration switch protein FrsA (DUF1100 family)